MFHHLAIMNLAAINMVCMCPYNMMPVILLVRYLEREQQDEMEFLFSIVCRSSTLISTKFDNVAEYKINT